MTTTHADTRNDVYDGPAVELFETVKDTTRVMDEARVKQAEAVAAVISAHVTPLDDFTHGLHAVFTSNPGAGPLVTGGTASEAARASSNAGAVAGSSFGATSSHTASVGVDDVVACVALPTGEVATVASVERVADELPTPTEGVLAKLLDCTRSRLVTLVRRIMTAVVLMPKLWSLAKAGVISFDRVLYTAGRVVRAGVCIPVFDDMLTNKPVDVPWKTYRRHVNEVLAMLTTPETQAENAKRNRSVSYWVNDDGTATLSLTGPVLEMEAFYQRVRGTARAIMSNHIEPFTARLTDEQQALFITENNGETTEVRVGDLGRVEVDDDRLMDQLTLDLITGAKPSTTLRARVTPTGKQAPIKVTTVPVDAEHTGAACGVESEREEGSHVQSGNTFGVNAAGVQTQGVNATAQDANRVDASGPGDADGSVWAERCEARQAEDVYELELCVSMPEKEEWLKSQASINLTVPVLHFLMNNPPPNKRKHQGKGSGKAPGSDRPGPENQDPGRNHKPREQRTEEQAFGRHRTEEQAFMDQGSSAPPGAGPGAGEPLSAAAGSGLDFGLPIKVDPDARVPVMMNNRVPLDARTADEVIAQAKWVYRMFTDPETGVVLESTPTKYYIPAALKRMVEARHPDCSAPWCATPARVCEKDHIEPFNHEDPENGGLTVMENLHPLCKRHHQEKTQKRLRVDRMDDGSLAWVFPRIGAMLVYPPESRINQRQYERLIEYFDTGDQDISDTINEYLATEPSPEDVVAHNSGNETVYAEAIWQGVTEREYVQEVSNMRSFAPGTVDNSGRAQKYPREVADEYAIAGEVFNGDTRPWQPSEEPPPF